MKRFAYSPAAILILAAALFFLARAAYRAYDAERQSRQNLEAAQADADALVQKNDFLTAGISKLKSERGFEEMLREKFPIVKGDEKMVILVEPEGGQSTESPPASPGFWANLVNLFR